MFFPQITREQKINKISFRIFFSFCAIKEHTSHFCILSSTPILIFNQKLGFLNKIKNLYDRIHILLCCVGQRLNVHSIFLQLVRIRISVFTEAKNKIKNSPICASIFSYLLVCKKYGQKWRIKIFCRLYCTKIFCKKMTVFRSVFKPFWRLYRYEQYRSEM